MKYIDNSRQSKPGLAISQCRKALFYLEFPDRQCIVQYPLELPDKGNNSMLRFVLTGSSRLILLAIALIICACASTPTTYSNADATADFSKYKTFGFFEKLATNRAGYESAETRYLKTAVTREMNNRGLVYSEKPELKVNFNINSEEKIRSTQTPTTGGYYGYRGGYYGGMVGYETRIDQYTEGTLNIDVVDAGTNKLVWEGAIVGRVTKKVKENLEPVIDEAVREVFKSFPIPPKPANTTPDR